MIPEKPYNSKSNRDYIQSVVTNKKRHFMICDFCFWCASLYGHDTSIVGVCPICQKRLKLLPISNGEVLQV